MKLSSRKGLKISMDTVYRATESLNLWFESQTIGYWSKGLENVTKPESPIYFKSLLWIPAWPWATYTSRVIECADVGNFLFRLILRDCQSPIPRRQCAMILLSELQCWNVATVFDESADLRQGSSSVSTYFCYTWNLWDLNFSVNIFQTFYCCTMT